MEYDKDSLQNEMDTKARNLLNEGDAFDGVIKHFLDGFAYRYIETPLTSAIETIKVDERTYRVEAIDNRMVEVLKIGNEELRPSLVEFAKSHPVKEKATVAYRIEVVLGAGSLKTRALVDWNYPEHDFSSEKVFIKESELVYDDILIVRNKLALHLEQVSELFL